MPRNEIVWTATFDERTVVVVVVIGILAALVDVCQPTRYIGDINAVG